MSKHKFNPDLGPSLFYEVEIAEHETLGVVANYYGLEDDFIVHAKARRGLESCGSGSPIDHAACKQLPSPDLAPPWV